MLLFYPSFSARLCDGGVAGEKRIDRRLWRLSRFAPTPDGIDIARPLRVRFDSRSF
jgi:hypothetical protein